MKEKMMFSEDKFVNGELFFEKGKIYEVEGASIARWIKRGGVIVDYAGSFEEPKSEGKKEIVEGPAADKVETKVETKSRGRKK